MLNKEQSRLWVKIVAIVVAGAFVVTLVPLIGSLDWGGSGGQENAAENPVDQQALMLITQLQQQIAANPTSTVLLVQLGNAYFDWAGKQQQEERELQAQSNFTLAADAYSRALREDPENADVRVDRSVAVFYTGKMDEAIKEAEVVRKADPKHANARFNLGIFYAQAGNREKAGEVWAEYLELQPEGQGADYVRQQLEELR